MKKENNSDSIDKEISEVKKQLFAIDTKINLVLEILNNFTIMLAEEDEIDDDYDSDETWVPKDEEFWQDDTDESI